MGIRVESLTVLLLLGTLPSVAWGAEFEVSPGEDLEAAIAALQPGDELVVRGGDYSVTERFSINLVGTAADPILIRAADGEVPHVNRPNANENIVDIENAEHVEIRGIQWSGGSAGIRIQAARDFTLSQCEVHSTNDVAVRANDVAAVYERVHIVGNHIHDTNNTGEGMYLGCNEGGCRLLDSVIERNWVHHTNQASVSQGDGIEIKEGSAGNTIRDNVIHDTNYPCILVYATQGNGDANLIEGNAMWNCGNHGIQAAADATIRNNIILSAAVDGIAMQPHQSGAPSNLRVVHNTILVPTGAALSVRGATGTVDIANNALYAQAGNAVFVGGEDGGGTVTLAGNVGTGGVSGARGGVTPGDLLADFAMADHGGAPPMNVFPAADGGLVGVADPAYAATEDFNTLPHNVPPDVGAYAFDPDGNPGWTLEPDFKEFPDDADPPQGTGSTGDSGSDTLDSDGPFGSTGSPSDSDADNTAGDVTGDPTGPAGGTDGIPTGTDTGAAEDGDDGGCGCTSGPGRSGPGWLVFGLVALLRRRRP